MLIFSTQDKKRLMLKTAITILLYYLNCHYKIIHCQTSKMSDNDLQDFQIESSNNPLNQAFIYQGDIMSCTQSQLLSELPQQLQSSFNGNLSSICSKYSAWNQSDFMDAQFIFGGDLPIAKRAASTFEKNEEPQEKAARTRGRRLNKNLILNSNQAKLIIQNQDKNAENTQMTQIAQQSEVKFTSQQQKQQQKQIKSRKIDKDKHKNKKTMSSMLNFHKKEAKKKF